MVPPSAPRAFRASRDRETHGPTPFDAVVFAGGGCRCFWQLGFWQEARELLGSAQRFGGVSAGSAMACTVLTDSIDGVLEDFIARVQHNERNFYPEALLQGERPFPHAQIYRDTILGCLAAGRMNHLMRGPELRVLVARPPEWATPPLALALGLAAHQADRAVRHRVHGVWARRIGFQPEVVSVRECQDEQAVADLIFQSSCTPPALPLCYRDQGPVLDGGVVDAASVDTVLPAERVLVLLTRHDPDGFVPEIPGRTYLRPSQPVPVSKWDYTSAERVRATFDLGRRDGAAFAERELHHAA
ncbi:patatin-like phospholipase family protein [Myxococcota bacterium]|nr:patatin-like phospholipase family protein [Myxococcota bacterium]